jgi:outer membrane protein assembly factor BamA
VVLIVEAELDRGTHFETGFGHDALDGWYLNLAGIRWNSPMGRGGHLRAGARLGLRTAGVYGEWYRPGGGSPDLHLRLFSGSRHWIAYEGDAEFRQQIQEGTLELGMGLRGRGGAAARIWIGFAASEPDSVLEEFGGDDTRIAGDLVPAFEPREARTVGRLELEFDRRDDVSAPRRGSSLGFSAEGALPERGAAYSRLRGDARLFLPLPQRAVLGLHIAAALVSKEAPYHQRLVFGGTGTVRGYPDAALSGALGARARWHATAELRRPLLGLGDARPRIDGILFFDVGTHWGATGHAHRARSAVGYGLRVRVPWIQRFGIDVGIPLGEEPTDDPFWITLGLGHSF